MATRTDVDSDRLLRYRFPIGAIIVLGTCVMLASFLDRPFGLSPGTLAGLVGVGALVVGLGMGVAAARKAPRRRPPYEPESGGYAGGGGFHQGDAWGDCGSDGGSCDGGGGD